jgi:hypothetical protein
MKISSRLIVALPLLLFLLSSFSTKEDLAAKQLYSKVVLKRNDKAQSIAVGIPGQEVTIFIKTKEILSGGERGTELWVKGISIYQGQKTKSKKHRYMFGANAYQEHLIIRHVNKKTREVSEFQLNIDIQIIDSESELDLNV